VYELDVYNDPDVINAQFGNAALSIDPLLVNQLGGAVTSVGGALGPSVLISTSASSGFSLSAVGVGNTLTLSFSVSSQANARTALGLGGLATLNPSTNVPNSSVVAAAAYSQTDFQSVINTLNDLLTNLRAAGIQA